MPSPFKEWWKGHIVLPCPSVRVRDGLSTLRLSFLNCATRLGHLCPLDIFLVCLFFFKWKAPTISSSSPWKHMLCFPQHMFSWRNKINIWITLLIWSCDMFLQEFAWFAITQHFLESLQILDKTFKGSIFLKNRHFIIQEKFNKLIYGINTIIKCGFWQHVKFQFVSRSYLWINVANINSEIW